MTVEITCVVSSPSLLGEGAVWDHRASVLWWVDIHGGQVHRYDPAGDRNKTWEWGEAVGCLAVRESGGLVLATRTGFHLFDPDGGTREALVDPEADIPDNRYNDGTTDRAGRFWAGTMKEGGKAERRGRFYRLDADRRNDAISGSRVHDQWNGFFAGRRNVLFFRFQPVGADHLALQL